MGIISAADLEGLAIFRQAAADFEKTLADLSTDQRIRRIAKLLIDLMACDLLVTSEREIATAGVASLDEVREAGRRLIHLSAELEPKVRELEAFMMDRVYRHHRVVRMTTKAKRFIGKIFEAYRANPDQLRPDYRRRARTEGLERVIADYIAGMTDRFAQDDYRRLYEPFERM
jgi:dGTPase